MGQSTQGIKIQFLDAMNRKIGLFSELGQFFIDEKIATDRELRDILNKSVDNQAAEFYILLKRCEKIVLLVDLEWKLLPTEFMKLIIVTSNGVKEYVWAN